VDVREVTVNFSGFKALNELNFSIERGELRVVIGPNGAGKTTLLDVITGKLRPTSGTVVFQPADCPPREISRLGVEDIARLGIGRNPDPQCLQKLDRPENLSCPSKAAAWGRLDAPFSQNGAPTSKRSWKPSAWRPRPTCRRHPGPRRKAVAGARYADGPDPELLLVDEPVAGMSPRESERTGNLLMAWPQAHFVVIDTT